MSGKGYKTVVEHSKVYYQDYSQDSCQIIREWNVRPCVQQLKLGPDWIMQQEAEQQTYKSTENEKNQEAAKSRGHPD